MMNPYYKTFLASCRFAQSLSEEEFGYFLERYDSMSISWNQTKNLTDVMRYFRAAREYLADPSRAHLLCNSRDKMDLPSNEQLRDMEEALSGLAEDRQTAAFYFYATQVGLATAVYKDTKTEIGTQAYSYKYTEIRDIYDEAISSYKPIYVADSGSTNKFYRTGCLFETIGKRTSYEDQFIVSHTRTANAGIFHGPKFMRELIDEATVKCSSYRAEGTTITLGYLDPNSQSLTVGHVGDSRIYLIEIDVTTRAVNVFPLTTDHEPEDATEEYRVLKESSDTYRVYDPKSGSRDTPRIGAVGHRGKINMSRSLGDMKYGNALSKEPDIIQMPLDLSSNKRSYILSSCDGLYEASAGIRKIDASFISEAFQRAVSTQRSPTLEIIGSTFIKESLLKGSGDNITMMLFQILPEGRPIVFGIMDGHGGMECAKTARQSVSESISTEVSRDYRSTINPAIEESFSAKIERFSPSFNFEDEEIMMGLRTASLDPSIPSSHNPGHPQAMILSRTVESTVQDITEEEQISDKTNQKSQYPKP